MNWADDKTDPIADIQQAMKVMREMRDVRPMLMLPPELKRRVELFHELIAQGWHAATLARLQRRARTKLNHLARRRRRRARRAFKVWGQPFGARAVDDWLPPWTPPRRFERSKREGLLIVDDPYGDP